MKLKSMCMLLLIVVFQLESAPVASAMDTSYTHSSSNVGTSGSLPENDEAKTIPGIVKRVVPSYPPIALEKHLQGRVTVKVLVSATGIPEEPEIVGSNNSAFDSAAIAAVMKYKFSPSTLKGKPTSDWVFLPFSFELTSHGPQVSQSEIGFIGGVSIIVPPRGASIPRDSSTPPPDYVPVRKNPRLIRKVLPVYPVSLLKDSMKAELYVKIWISATGTPHRVIILKQILESEGRSLPFHGTLRHPYVMARGRKVNAEIFDRPAEEAAMKCGFTPAIGDSSSVAVWVVIRFMFYENGTCAILLPRGIPKSEAGQIQR